MMIQIKNGESDRSVEILVGGEPVFFADYDEGGWGGLDMVDRLVTTLAEKLDVDCEYI
jgi:hypothetical protein